MLSTCERSCAPVTMPSFLGGFSSLLLESPKLKNFVVTLHHGFGRYLGARNAFRDTIKDANCSPNRCFRVASILCRNHLVTSRLPVIVTLAVGLGFEGMRPERPRNRVSPLAVRCGLGGGQTGTRSGFKIPEGPELETSISKIYEFGTRTPKAWFFRGYFPPIWQEARPRFSKYCW